MSIIRVYGNNPSGHLESLEIGGRCPYCQENSRFTLACPVNGQALQAHNARELFTSYICAGCSRVIPIRWAITGWEATFPRVAQPTCVLRVTDSYDFEHVPTVVQAPIQEALNCLSVDAFNGFSAVVRRSIQIICTNLGAQGTTKIQNQINDVYSQGMLDAEQKSLAEQIMLTGHDGAHPHLPEVNGERATLLLDLLQDITFQIYTRPGKIKQSAELRRQAIQKPA